MSILIGRNEELKMYVGMFEIDGEEFTLYSLTAESLVIAIKSMLGAKTISFSKKMHAADISFFKIKLS